MNYIGIGVWLYMAVGVFMGLQLIRDPDYSGDVDELAGDHREFFHNKINVLVIFALVGPTVWLYSMIKKP